MMNLFKEVSSAKSAEKTETAKPEDETMEQNGKAPDSVGKGTIKEDKHGDPGTCCGGCS
ncbi:CCGSCS motif protein [Marinobacter sp. F3R11]|uniref:CCGSCS motif protein n=1 Tax=Marinobacter sp. F3R11 TaxID=2267231 RepID=UPI000DEAFF96|nr:CCGSCS motif protein [Marinobacter sp. F3R11]RBW50656.1 CCGSCS motif protein [Marinobacter sp. F3R11]